MSGRFRMFKACVLLLVAVSLTLSFASCKRSSYNAEYEKKLADLIYEKQMLINEKNQLDSVMEKELGNASFMSFVFVEIDAELYTDVYPMMSAENEADLVGIVALSEDELPGMTGNISIDQYNELISAGWGNALYWNGEGELADFIERMQTLLGGMEIELPQNIIFASGVYTKAFDEILLQHGIENAVHSGEEELRYIEQSNPDGVWHPGRIGWRWLGESTRLKQRVETDYGYALFEINFGRSAEDSRTSFFSIDGESENDEQRREKFERMLNSFRTSMEAGKIDVCRIEDTRTRFELYFERLAVLTEEKEKRLAEIDSLINDVTRRMTELYNEYY